MCFAASDPVVAIEHDLSFWRAMFDSKPDLRCNWVDFGNKRQVRHSGLSVDELLSLGGEAFRHMRCDVSEC